jgi:PAS domain-containing protein
MINLEAKSLFMSIQYSAVDLTKLANSSDYISIYDKELIIREWNDAAALRFNISRPDAIGARVIDFIDDAEDDYRVVCYKECVEMDKTFFFPSVSFLYTSGIYTQVIIPLKTNTTTTHVLTVMREHTLDEAYTQDELLLPLLKGHS